MSVALERMDEVAAPSLRADMIVRAKATAEAIVIPLLALLASAAIFALLVAALGKSPLQLFDLMYRGAFGTWFSLAEHAAARGALCCSPPSASPLRPGWAWSSSAARVRWRWAASPPPPSPSRCRVLRRSSC